MNETEFDELNASFPEQHLLFVTQNNSIKIDAFSDRL